MSPRTRDERPENSRPNRRRDDSRAGVAASEPSSKLMACSARFPTSISSRLVCRLQREDVRCFPVISRIHRHLLLTAAWYLFFIYDGGS